MMQAVIYIFTSVRIILSSQSLFICVKILKKKKVSISQFPFFFNPFKVD